MRPLGAAHPTPFHVHMLDCDSQRSGAAHAVESAESPVCSAIATSARHSVWLSSGAQGVSDVEVGWEATSTRSTRLNRPMRLGALEKPTVGIPTQRTTFLPSFVRILADGHEDT